MFRQRWQLAATCVLFLLLATACGGGNGGANEYYDANNDSNELVPQYNLSDGNNNAFDDYSGDSADDEAMDDEESFYAEAETSQEQVAQATPVPGPADVFFEDYGVNPFIAAEDDNLSTFAVDVDTGAYTVMRRYVDDGGLPPADSVRAEEYINYFDQDYALPTDRAFAIHLEGAPAPFAESDNYHLVRVGLQGYLPPAETRPNALLIFVIDVSGSMAQENRLGLVKDSLRFLTFNLRDNDRVGIVVYGTNARVVLEPTPVNDTGAILEAIDRLEPEGSTNAEAGLQAAYRLADSFARAGEINRLILCSDGVANVGNTTAEAILRHAEDGVYLSTFGFGMGNYNDVLMEQLADQGDGSYAYIDTFREAERVFETQLTSTILTIAKDVKIQVEFNPEVVDRYRLIGYENRAVADADFRNDNVDAGEIGAGHSVTALYEVRLKDGADRNAAAMIVRVRYELPDSGAIVEIENSISRGQFAASFGEASPTFQLSAIVAEFAEILRESYWADNTVADLLPDIRRIVEYFPGNEDVAEFLRLAEAVASRGR